MKTRVKKPPVSVLFGNLTAKNRHQLLGTFYMSKTELTSLPRPSHCFQRQASEVGRNHCPFTGWPGDTCPSSCHQLRDQHDPRATSPMPKQGSLYSSYAYLISINSETFLLLYKLHTVPEITRGGRQIWQDQILVSQALLGLSLEEHLPSLGKYAFSHFHSELFPKHWYVPGAYPCCPEACG